MSIRSFKSWFSSMKEEVSFAIVFVVLVLMLRIKSPFPKKRAKIGLQGNYTTNKYYRKVRYFVDFTIQNIKRGNYFTKIAKFNK